MSKYFLAGTRLEDFEREMMRIPNFDKGKPSFPYTPEMCDCDLCVRAAEQHICQKDGSCICKEERRLAGCLPTTNKEDCDVRQ